MKKSRVQESPAKGVLMGLNHREILVDKRREVMSSMGLKFDTISKTGRVGEEDQAQMSHDEFINLRLSKIDYDVLRLINEAIDRIDSGDFGMCQRCEEPIAPRRLQVLPWAKYCVRCQERVAMRQHESEEDEVFAPVGAYRA
ncbi:MAG TPA: TraR/DksA family transcriptional regulator [Bryobacteraceae bacterium]|nr:TraR/DksA family transcriptional regulator [Bryobacteraceae bacterium]